MGSRPLFAASRLLVATALLLTFTCHGRPAFAIEVAVKDLSAAEWTGGTSDPALKDAGASTVRWAHAVSSTLTLQQPPTDWTGYTDLSFRLHSEVATGSRFMMIISSENPATTGDDYWSAAITLDFTGWRTFRYRLRNLGAARSPLGWNHITGFRFTAAGWGNTPNPKAVVHLADFKLIKVEGPRMTDQEFFAALDLTRPDLKAVKQAVDAGDWTAAKHAFVEHLKARTSPKWYFDWRGKPAPDKRPAHPRTTDADRYARNDLWSCGVWHDFKDHLDWNANPMPDQYAEWTWQLNRHPFWEALGRAYWETGDEKYARAFVAQMTDWVRSQPEPEDSGNYVYSAWRTIETGIRTFSSWPNSFLYFLSSPSFNDDAVITMVKSFADHADHLMRYPTSGNWLTMEANGLYHIGVLFPEYKDAANWRQTAIDRLYAELDNQVYPDGAQIELAPGYHNVSLNSFEMPLRLARMNDLPLPGHYLDKLERMFDYNLYMSMPNRAMPGLNDSGDTDIRGWMAKGAEYFPQREDFRWIATAGKEGKPPAELSHPFPYAGYYVMRSGWDADARYLLLDAGPFGYGHQHEDKLTIVAAAYGRVHIIDPGNYPYDNSQWRRYFIDTFAHNTILVDDLPQRRRGAKDRREYVVDKPLPHTWVSTEAFDYAAGVYDEGYGSRENRIAVHRRHVVFVKSGHGSTVAPGDYWIVVDTLEPLDGKEHHYDAMFHLNADAIAIDPSTLKVETHNTAGSNFAIIPLPEPGITVSNQAGQEKPYVQGWIRKGDYGVQPVPTPVYSRSATGPTHFVFVLYPIPAGQQLPVKKVTPVAVTSGKAIAVDIDFGERGADRFVLSLDPTQPVQVGDLSLKGQVVFVGGRR